MGFPARYARCAQPRRAFKVTDLACVKNFSGGLLWLAEKLKMMLPHGARSK